MKILPLAFLASVLMPSLLLAEDGEPPTYIANFTSNPPTIDGLMTGDAEWSQADSSGSWTLFGSGGAPDPTNNRFNVLWDESGMYLRHQVDHGDWPAPPIGIGKIEHFYENLSLYLDPNKDGETNANLGPDDTGIDGYVIAFNQPLGSSQRTPDTPDLEKLGIEEKAHVNNLFGNHHRFAGFNGLQIVQTTSADESFGYTEMYIPWEDFNSSDPEVWNPEFEDTGLYHPHAPFDGDQWYFNILRIQTNGEYPAWAYSSGSVLFAARPHGVLRFSQGSSEAGDVNGDGVCDALDIDRMAKAVREEETGEIFDVNVDGVVDWEDHTHMVEVLHNTYFGDSNLDGEFNTSDFVAVFTAGQYEDGIPLNSLWATGDWDGDTEFGTGDFVKAFTAGGYEVGPRNAVRAVPEPSAMLLLLIGLLCLARRR